MRKATLRPSITAPAASPCPRTASPPSVERRLGDVPRHQLERVGRPAARRRGAVGPGGCTAGGRVRPLRLPPGHSAAAGRGLAGERQAGGTAVATRGAESSAAVAEAWSAVVERRPLHPAAAVLAGPRLGVRPRAGPDTGRAAVPHVDGDRRIHAGMPGDRGGAAAAGG